MARSSSTSSRVFFPWEERRGLARWLGGTRVRATLAAAFALTVLLAIRLSESHAQSLRSTRAELLLVHQAMTKFRADHPGVCPKHLGELVTAGYLRRPPVDGWNRPLRLRCPARQGPSSYALSSDGPDGIAGGLDRVE